MYLIEFVANEAVSGDIELDLDGVDTKDEAKELAEKEIRRSFPTYEDIEITLIKEIA